MKNKRMIMVKYKKAMRVSFILAILVFTFQNTFAQQQNEKQQRKSISFMRKAEKAKAEGNFAVAEAYYRRALANNEKNAEASYNFGHLYTDNKLQTEAMSRLIETAKHATSKELKHKAYHNLGNAYMAQKDYRQAVKAYEDALRNDPTDDETRYNLALAKKKLKKKGGGSKNNKKKKKKEKQDKKKKNKNNQNKQNKQNKSQNKKQQNKPNKNKGNNKPQQNKQNQNKQKKSKQQKKPQKGKISKKQAKNMLRAVQEAEKRVQQKRDRLKAKRTHDKSNKKGW